MVTGTGKTCCRPLPASTSARKVAARLHMPDECVDLRPGYLYLVPAYTRHSYECHGKFTHYYLHLYEGFKKESDIFDLYDFPIEVKAEGYESHLFANICKAHPDAKPARKQSDGV